MNFLIILIWVYEIIIFLCCNIAILNFIILLFIELNLWKKCK